MQKRHAKETAAAPHWRLRYAFVDQCDFSGLMFMPDNSKAVQAHLFDRPPTGDIKS